MNSAITTRIKMYRLGELGDCFLLTFTGPKQIYNILIDCGTFRNSGKSKGKLKRVVQNIQEQLNGQKLDVIVGTHQHNDHLSGFFHEADLFRTIGTKQVWLSWLDDPTDKLANKIGKDFNNALAGMHAIERTLRKWTGFGIPEAHEKVSNILGFYGATSTQPGVLPAQALKILQELSPGRPEFLSPGDNFSLPNFEEGIIKVYVLGPPKNEASLKNIKPGEGETYDPELTLIDSQVRRFLDAFENLYQSKPESRDEAAYPFYEPDSNSNFFDQIIQSYNSRRNSWRQIDLEWLQQAERLALWMNTYTNNTSLVLAFEIVPANKVLLFAADAQTGNWSSWKDIVWKNDPPGLNWMSLLEKTVLYKVGHHGSHNATLVDGLNAMTHPELVAMVPVDRSDPNITKKKNPWKMPATNLFRNLKLKTKNRVLCMDTGFDEDCKPKQDKMKCPWKGSGLQVPAVNDLYVEYVIES